jgi:hypothetical protein
LQRFRIIFQTLNPTDVSVLHGGLFRLRRR